MERFKFTLMVGQSLIDRIRSAAKDAGQTLTTWASRAFEAKLASEKKRGKS